MSQGEGESIGWLVAKALLLLFAAALLVGMLVSLVRWGIALLVVGALLYAVWRVFSKLRGYEKSLEDLDAPREKLEDPDEVRRRRLEHEEIILDAKIHDGHRSDDERLEAEIEKAAASSRHS